jgi:cellulose synthase/poly-beta-1,6-N-acetylglucosamine synthase-like glycosyltransferase
LNQSRPADEIIVVNDGSTDRTAEILAGFRDRVGIVNIPVATGNKSHAQEIGLYFITGDVFIATDGDTILHKDFVKCVEQDFEHPEVAAVGGYIKSMGYNWLTECRAFEYAVGQNIHKLAQSYIDFVFVIPGAAGAFRTQTFFDNISFDHDTLTEDLDFTYRFHKKGLKVFYDRRAIVFTQDPATLSSYINQMRRWQAGGWQCLLKHRRAAFSEPKMALELSLMYIEGVVFSFLLFILPLLSFSFFQGFIKAYFSGIFLFAVFAAWKEKRFTILYAPFPYLFLLFLNAYIFLEQMFREVVMHKKNLYWFTPERIRI